MELIENLVRFFKKPGKETRNTAPKGLCPVCWGYQEYDAKIRKIYKDKQIDVNNHQASYMLIQEFVKHHIEGIKLKENELLTCPKCSKNDKDTTQ